MLTSGLATLGIPVGDVIRIGPEEQMIGIDAGPYVALVTDMHSLGYRSHEVGIGEAAGLGVLMPVPKSSVSFRVTAAEPEPALFG